jgi:signal transduction histidine kinase/CheY-like chemotaxis protein
MLRKKNQKKDLQNKIERLEKENNQLKTRSQESKKLNVSAHNLSLYFATEQIDILIYNPDNEQLEKLDSSIQLNVLFSLPKNREELIDIIPYDEQEQFRNGLNKIGSKSPFKYQGKIHLVKDGVKETKQVEIVLINNSHTVTIVFKDISLFLKQKRELSKVKEKIDESDKLKSALLANVSHQIRTPLNSITGFSELLASGETDKSKRKEYIDIIKRQSKRILNLIDNISEISKLEAGKINLSSTPCNLSLLLNELALGFNQQRAAKRREMVELELILPETPVKEILSDSGRLQQVLLNIINFSQRNTLQGKIQFGYTIDEENKKVDFFIHDTSEGLTKEEQKVIFNRFMMTDDAEKTKLEDAGLGLTISREIIKAMGGKIWVESEIGKGTSFFFTIPYEKVTSEPVEETEYEVSEEQFYNWSNKVILIVDDEDVNAMFLDAVFQDTGARTLFAKNGLQAVELIKNINKIDLVLMDLKMPVMNGIEATRAIRKLNQTIPIIAQTAMVNQEDMNKCLDAGCNSTIIKPIEVEELLLKVNHYFAN